MRYYIDINEEMGVKLKESVNESDIVEALENLVEREADNQSSDELAAYNSISDIREDDNLSEVEARQLELKAQRRSGFNKR